ncbi:MAG: V-type ATP synthase subunit A, partial [Oscillospiraceae bacterium]
MNSIGKIVKVAGPLVVADGMSGANMYDVVRVGRQRLIGEIIEMRGEHASIQVYEETAGIAPGDTVESTGAPLSVELAPGLITTIYDGIQRPLEGIRAIAGNTITRGVQVDPIDRTKKWEFVPVAKVGDKVIAGDVLGTVEETIVVRHKVLVPNGLAGEVVEIKSGSFTVIDPIASIKKADGSL